MLTIANRFYESFTKKGLPQLGFLRRNQIAHDLENEDLSTLDPDWLMVEIRHKENQP